ncbi:MAG: glycosyltransferase family 9 protein [Alphaproteobacteria bacterium]|nr:glycosyltransferase family 9 protein [Alphaproteobacteria bacterium]
MALTWGYSTRLIADMKILFITSTRLGDAILSTGILEHLHQKYPQAEVTVACGPLPKTIFEGFPNVERIIALKKQKYHGHWFKLWREVVGTHWDKVIDLRDSAVSRLLLSKERYIFGKHIDKSKHKVEQAAQLMGLNDVPAPKLYFTDAQQKFAKELVPDGGPVLGVGPSANWIGKTWPAERFIEVVNWMIGSEGPMEGARVAVFAAPGEESQAQPVLESVPAARRIDGIAKGNPGEIAAGLARCDFYIGNDSGLMHAAAAAGVKTLGLFGPSYPHLYAPWGAHAAYARTPETFDELINFEGYHPQTLKDTLMKSLEVQEVTRKIKNLVDIM